MDALTSVLEFRDVTFRPNALLQLCGVTGVNLALGRGEIALVSLEEGREESPLAVMAQGLEMPEHGCVSFNGEDWSQLTPSRISNLRGRIRRVYQHYGWISNLDIMENICLAELYHSGRNDSDVEDEARALARGFGVDPIPNGRPARGNSMVLRKLEWVRAFMGTPELILLECPCRGASKADGPGLARAMHEIAGKGAAVLWLEDDPRVIDCPEIAAARRYRMDGETLMAV